MSAFIVSKLHVDHLAQAIVHAGLATDPDQTGQALWRENLASIHYRYPDTAENDAHYPGPIGFRAADVDNYVYLPPAEQLHPSALLGLLMKYDYQTCEHPTYRDSAVFALVERLAEWLRARGATSHSRHRAPIL